MVFGESLSVRISAQTRSFESGIDDARDELSKFNTGALATSSSLQVVQSRVDETEDEVSALSRSLRVLRNRLFSTAGAAGTTAGSFATLSAGTSGLSFSVGSLSTSFTSLAGTLAIVTGAATALLSTLFPLAAVLGTLTAGTLSLAGAFGAVVGSGILAFGRERGEQVKERLEGVRDQIQALEELEDKQGELSEANQRQLRELEDLQTELEDQTSIFGGLEAAISDARDEILPLIADFGEDFLPLIRDAIDALPTLVENILNALGSLTKFREALRDFGETVMDTIPTVVTAMVDLAERALPMAVEFISWIGRNADPIFSGMLRVTEQLSRVFMGLADAFIRATPELTSLGTLILRTVVPALSAYLRLVEDIIQIGQRSDGFVDFVRRGMQQLAAWINGPGLSLLSDVVNSVLNGLNTLLSGESADRFFQGLINLMTTVLKRLSSWFDSGGQQLITNILKDLFGTIATILTTQEQVFRSQIFDPIANILSSLFDSLAVALNSDEAGRLSAAAGNLASAIGGTLMNELIEYVNSEAFNEDLKKLAGAVANTLGKASVAVLKDNVMSGDVTAFGGIGEAALSAIGDSLVEANSPSAATTPSDPKALRPPGQTPRGEIEVGVNVEGDDSLAEIIRENATAIVREKERRTKRNTGGTTRP